jgi:hypothetical protein
MKHYKKNSCLTTLWIISLLLNITLATPAMADITITSVTGPAMELGYGWQQDVSVGPFPTYILSESNDHSIYITFSDGSFYRFAARLDPWAQQLFPYTFGTFGFSDAVGEIIVNNSLHFSGSAALTPLEPINFYFDGGLGSGTLRDATNFTDVIDPLELRLTLWQNFDMLSPGGSLESIVFDIPDWRTFGQSTQVPEPATMLLLGLGLMGLAGLRRKIQK